MVRRLRRRVYFAKHMCPHCGHGRSMNKVGKNVFGWFCTKCKKKNNGKELIINKHGKELWVAK